MKSKIITLILLTISIPVYSQTGSITNTLGTSGEFTLKDNTTTFLSLSQSTGYLSLNRSIELPNTTSPSLGVIFKGADSFLHNYGGGNTFLGINAGNFTMIGNNNTSVGFQTMHSNTTGSSNSAFGNSALFTNSTGIFNSAFGYSALYNNSNGYANSAFGTYALNNNSTGYKNSSFGYRALTQNQTGTRNTSVGYKSLYSNTSGFQNTAVGDSALYNNSGNYNTALGYNAGSNVTTGANLTLIGIDANPSSPTAVDQITLGNIFVSSLRCNVQTITSLSDARDKKNISDLTLGLDFITKLKPRQFNWDKREWYDGNKSDGSKMKEEPTAGFIAQELDEIQTAENAEWLNLVLKDNPEKWEATPGNLFPVLVKSVQELKLENDELKMETAELKSKNQNLEDRLTRYEEMQTVLLKKMEQIESNEQLFKVQLVNSENNNQ